MEIIRNYNLRATISEKRRGKWKALNDAISMANGDYILFLDSDTKIVDLSLLKVLMPLK
ncbi:MAG TPA: glycosyltransferase [Archaeoglobaceae archaeon]|nr:glycosyltransferase [Archaeoglobaceae archaeon]